MAKLNEILKRHVLLVGLAAVVVPLLSILGLQYWSLSELEKTSIVAGQVGMKNYLNDAQKEVKNFYKAKADEILTVPAYAISGEDLKRAKYHFSQCQVEGVKRLFIAAFDPEGEAEVLFFDPSGRKGTSEDVPTPELHAVRRAVAPMRVLSKEGTTVQSPMAYFEERDIENRVIYKPILDDSQKVVGAAGMILDRAFFVERLVPRVVGETLPKFFPDGRDRNVIVSLYEGRDKLLYTSQEVEGQDDYTGQSMPYFWEYNLVIRSRHTTPKQWAHWNFNVSLGLSLLMTAVLIGGIILALRTASREMRLSQMKADFVSNVSHELRTPLASIRVFGEFMKLGRVRDSEKIREYGEHIETESRRLTQLINNILDFSKIESGRKTYQFERANVEGLVSETLKTCEVRLKQKGFSVVFHGSPRPLSLAVIDRDAIAQALMNLLDNAVKYSEHAEKKEVTVRVGQKENLIHISVTDHGVGIAPEEQKKIFEKFYRVSTGLVHDVKGSGLGLALVKHIVEAHRGSVTVESAPGRGSTFTITLPAADSVADHAETQRPAPPLLGSDPPLGFGLKN
ncbi:MAG TPA: HAMP domain-containing sensor histidine kinase [Pyrinomonadaceae bacterium]|nr:HAMP domain-containing sensor histidine kinase [Pyrinomonadaceae bacterium]